MNPLIANRFRPIAELGRGAMGEVHLVADTLDGGREVALKLIHGSGGEEAKLRFKEEFRAMSRLRHPNTIAVRDFGQVDEHTHFLTMDVVPGEDLATLVAGQPMPLERFYALALQLLRALGFIHDRLYIHRDIKSSNIRITPAPPGAETLVLMDFGLMIRAGQGPGSKVGGTPAYLAPEVIRGAGASHLSDMYSIGCLAFEMLTGQVPFSGRVVEVLRAHVHTEAPRLRTLRPDAPEALEAIVARLLAKEPGDRYPHATDLIDVLAELAGLDVGRAEPAQQHSYLASSVLVGREPELAQLIAAAAAARAGRGSALYLGGPAGTGKSRLLQELALHARMDDMLVLDGRCTEGGLAPYEPLALTLRPLLASTSAAEKERWSELLAWLFPEHISHLGATGAPADIPASVWSWVAEVSRRTPVLLCLEDLHWADAATITALNGGLAGLGDARILFVGTLRDDEVPAAAPLLEAVTEGGVTWLPLAPLDAPGVTSLVDSLLGRCEPNVAYAQAFYRATGGNPFFITEALRHLMESKALTRQDGVWRFPTELDTLAGLTSVDATVVARLARLPESAQRLARVASVIGRDMTLCLLLAAGSTGGDAASEEERLFTDLDELIARQFIVANQQRGDEPSAAPNKARYGFPHDRVREALYRDLPAAERRAVHQRCGERLEWAHKDDLYVYEMAYHFLASGDAKRGIHYARRAGEQALARGTTALALAHFRQALDVDDALPESSPACLTTPERAELWWRIGSLGMQVWPLEAAKALERLLALLASPEGQTLDPSGLRAIEAASFRASALGFAGLPMQGLASAEWALAHLAERGTPLHGAVLVSHGSSLFAAGRFDELVATAREAHELMHGHYLKDASLLVRTTRVGASSYQNAGCYQGRRPDAREVAESVAAAEASSNFTMLNVARHYEAIWCAWTGREPQTRVILDEIVQTCRRIGAPTYPTVLYLRAYFLWRRGEYDAARNEVERALASPHVGQLDFTHRLMVLLRGNIQLDAGDIDGALATFEAEQAASIEAGLAFHAALAGLGVADVWVARNDLAAARRALGAVSETCGAGPAKNPLVEAIAARILARVERLSKRYVEARALLDGALAIVTRPEQDNLLEQAHCYAELGALHLALEERPQALVALRRAGALYHEMKCLADLFRLNELLAKVHRVVAIAVPAVQQEERWHYLRALLL